MRAGSLAASEATKSDGGLTPNATTIAAIEELEMSNGNFTNGSLVFRIWRFDGGCEILAKFQYRNDAEYFAQLCVDRDTANGANKDNTFFYLAVCDRETFAKAFAASNTGGHHG